MSSQQKLIEESMLAQRGYLEIMRSRHHQWSYSADDPEIRRLHLEIADSIQETMDRYYYILNTYQSTNEALVQERSDIFAFYPVSQDA
jgi:hypothetical protein